MTKNRARKRATKALTNAADVRRPEAAYQADNRKLRTPDWGMIDFTEGPLRLLGEAAALDHYRPMEVVLKAALEKRWRIVQLTTLDTKPMPHMLAYVREMPTLIILTTTKGAPVNPVAVELLSGAHKDLNVAIQDAYSSRAWHDLLPGKVIDFSIEDGADLSPIPPRITEWHAVVNEIFTGNNPATITPKGDPFAPRSGFPAAVHDATLAGSVIDLGEIRSAPGILDPLTQGGVDGQDGDQTTLGGAGMDFASAIRQAMQTPPDIIIGEIRDTEESPASLDGDATGEHMSGDTTPDAAPFSLITGPPGTGRTAGGWARVHAADATLDALGVPKAAQEFATYPGGLFLVTGATGDGKTTSARALLRRAMVDRPRSAYAIVDGCEASFVGESGATVFPVEREGEAAPAIRNAVAAGADVILVDDLRDRAAAEAALAAALSGVLVFATMHCMAPDAPQRLLDMLPLSTDDEDAAAKARENRLKVQRAVRGVVELVLVRRADGRGRVLASEVWVKDDQAEEPLLLPAWRFEASLASLAARGVVAESVASGVRSERDLRLSL
jgi:Tfp pilus assembly pilus retraction ATPase PilT